MTPRLMGHVPLQATVLLALLQPAPETYELFDDILLLSEGVTAACLVAHVIHSATVQC